ncbi:MAG TPA: replication-associated recombination protein A [Candidatus Agrococcus pullicola]|uniref:Replication-associated recombination protein A n=1 Tax=Candidatus Agrococcus pullicola TaxID=2838429 RepID=A0A9D2C9X5_9MICO|nr:replication-associated recombination protein A [Candidatus Agrococcus pullicola]
MGALVGGFGGGSPTAPLAVRMRPRGLEEVVGQQHLLRAGSALRNLAEPGSNITQSVILWGPPGTGKTTLAGAVAYSSDRRFVELSAVTAGVRDVRRVMEEALSQRDLYGSATVLFLDEIHRFTKAQQDALLPGVENGWVTLIAATTENPSFSIITPLLSRSLLLTLQPLEESDLAALIDRAVVDERGLAGAVTLDDAARSAMVRLAQGDARRALTALEAAASHARAQAADETGATISAETVAESVDRALLRYDRDGDQHYDVTSAFIKSMRGSDPDAAVHYLARMIEAGEDPRFIARRLIVHAAEDVGMADPQALPIAVAAAESAQLIGLPEARIPLAEATIYIASAPKSNAVIRAIDSAMTDVRNGRMGPVPKHLRDAHYAGAKQHGHGKGYKYPHDAPNSVARQQHLPDELVGVRYYEPGPNGYERTIGERLEKIRAILRGDNQSPR